LSPPKSLHPRSPFGALIACFLLIVGAKFTVIQDAGSDLPFWDQWDAEAAQTYQPWLEGRLNARGLFEAHNEHRIVFTRVLSLALLVANGQWDARLQMTVNALLHTVALTLFVGLAVRRLSPASSVFVVAFTALVFGLPLALENTLAGFQSQFYFVQLFGLVHIAGTLQSRPYSPRWWVAQAVGIAGCFSMASGFLSSAVLAGFTLLDWLRRRHRPSLRDCTTFAWYGVLVAIGLGLRTEVPGHAPLQVQTPGALLSALLAWPLQTGWAAPLLALPIALQALGWFKSKDPRPITPLVVALGAWGWLQVIVLAYGRGNDIAGGGIASRYFDTLTLSLAVGAMAWAGLIEGALGLRQRRLFGTMAAIWLLAVGAGLLPRTLQAIDPILPELRSANLAREEAVRAFVNGTVGSLADRTPWHELPYPNPQRLEALLAVPVLRTILPASVRAPLALEADPGLTRGFSPQPQASGFQGRQWHRNDGGESALFASLPIQANLPLLRFRIADGAPTEPGGLMLAPSVGPPVEVRPGRFAPGEFTPIAVSTPEGHFRVVARIDTRKTFAFTEPVELGRLSWISSHALKAGPGLLFVGAVVGLVHFIAVLGIRIRRTAHLRGPAIV